MADEVTAEAVDCGLLGMWWKFQSDAAANTSSAGLLTLEVHRGLATTAFGPKTGALVAREDLERTGGVEAQLGGW